MAATPLQKDLIAETYQDVERLLYATVHEFLRRYGGDFEELMSSARYFFLRAYQEYDEQESSFITWVRFYVFKNLLEERRGQLRKQRLSKIEWTGAPELDSLPGQAHRFPIMEFLDELGDDAQAVARLALDSPKDLTELMMARGGNPHNRRRALREYLRDLGWTVARISESFREIAAVLTYF